LLGFYRTASSFLSELERRNAGLLDQVCVVDFNPQVFHSLQSRSIKVMYGDIASSETLSHAHIAEAEIVISSVPDSLLKGTTNEKLVRYVRSVNPKAKIVATADVFSQVDALYASGADYVTIARLAEANELIEAVTAAKEGLLADLRDKLGPRLRDRREVLP
jgi:voltage-gated potassium channel Kch